MKKLSVFLLAALLLAVMAVNTFGAEKSQRVYDQADLYSREEEALLEDKLQSAVDEMGMDYIVLTVSSLDGKTTRDYADDFYDAGGFGIGDDKSGVLFLIDMEGNTVYMCTTGNAINYFDDERINNLTDGNDELFGFLSDKKYYDGTAGVIDDTAEYYRRGIPEGAHTVQETAESAPKTKSLTFIEILIAVLVPGLIAFLRMNSTKKKYSMEAEKKGSKVSLLSYQTGCSFAYALSDDKLLNKTVTTRIISSDDNGNSKGQSTVHTSSSGTTHGGGGGTRKF